MYAPRNPAPRTARLFSFLVCFSFLLIPRPDSQSRRDTREPRLRSTPLGRPILFPLWRPSVLSDDRRPRSAFIACLPAIASSTERYKSPPRVHIAASVSVLAAFSRGHANARTLRDGRSPITSPMDIAMRKPPHRFHKGGGTIEGGELTAAYTAPLRQPTGILHARRQRCAGAASRQGPRSVRTQIRVLVGFLP